MLSFFLVFSVDVSLCMTFSVSLVLVNVFIQAAAVMINKFLEF